MAFIAPLVIALIFAFDIGGLLSYNPDNCNKNKDENDATEHLQDNGIYLLYTSALNAFTSAMSIFLLYFLINNNNYGSHHDN